MMQEWAAGPIEAIREPDEAAARRWRVRLPASELA
jgi:hypothetical protein